MELLSWLAAAVALGLCVAWFLAEERGRARWRTVERGRIPAGPDGGAYRPAPTLPLWRERAPRDVLRATLASVFVAQLLLVAMVAFFGVFAHAAGIGEVSALAAILWTPSLLVAGRLVREAFALLRRERAPGLSARGLAIWALLFYGALITGMLGLLRVLATLVRFPGNEGAGWNEFFALGLLLLGWPLLALAQSMLLERSVTRHGRDLL